MNKDINGKKCSKCGEFKEYKDFHKSKGMLDGYKSQCKSCHKEYRKAEYQRNSQYYKDKRKRHYEQNTEEIKEKQRQYYKENAEHYKENRKQRYQENIEKERKSAREYRQENLDKVKEYRSSEKGREVIYNATIRRRSQKHKVQFTRIQRKQILDRDNWTCQLCGCKVHDRHTGDWNTPDKAHVDHIIPISKGGNSENDNLQILCRTCNISKLNHIDDEIEITI